MRVMIAIPQQRTTVRPGKHAFELRRKWYTGILLGDDISCAHAQVKVQLVDERKVTRALDTSTML